MCIEGILCVCVCVWMWHLVILHVRYMWGRPQSFVVNDLKFAPKHVWRFVYRGVGSVGVGGLKTRFVCIVSEMVPG